MRPAVPVILAVLTLLPAAAADAAKPKPAKPKLWATVNVCDTKAHPDTVGIRASMPGTGVAKQRMYMRFQIQFFKASDNTWNDLGPDGDSGFLPVGSARFPRREAGRNFVLAAPSAGSWYRLRGLVTFEWRRGKTVLKRAQRMTRGGHKGTTGSDPKGFSAAECRIVP